MFSLFLAELPGVLEVKEAPVLAQEGTNAFVSPLFSNSCAPLLQADGENIETLLLHHATAVVSYTSIGLITGSSSMAVSRDSSSMAVSS